MTWDWQNLATLAVVTSALAYLAFKFVPGLNRKPAAGCSHCPVKKAGGGSGSCHDQPVVITLSAPRTSPPRRPGGSGTAGP